MVAPIGDGLDGWGAMPPDVSAGFELWAGTGGRSLRETARLLGIPAGTVRSWASRYRWRQRVADGDNAELGDILRAAIVAASRQHAANIAAAVTIRDDPDAPATARLRAIEWLSDIGGFAAVRAGAPLVNVTAGDTAAAGDAVDQDRLDSLARAGDTAALLALVRGQHPE